MYGALKLLNDSRCAVDIPKAVFSYWPFIDLKLRYKSTVGNICLTFRNAATSETAVRGAVLMFEGGHILEGSVEDISATLLDSQNPLSTSYTGEYRHGVESATLAKYDGVDDVEIQLGTRYILERLFSGHIDALTLQFARGLEPGKSGAIRFIYRCPAFLIADRRSGLHFHQCFQSLDRLRRFFHVDTLRRLEIPILSAYDDKQSGGFDVFFYMPLELAGSEFEHTPVGRLMPTYDFLGRAIAEPLKKMSWPASRVLQISRGEVVSVRLGEGFELAGVFSPRVSSGRIYMAEIKNDRGIVVVGNVAQSHMTVASQQSVHPLGPALATLLAEFDRAVREGEIDEVQQAAVQPHIDEVRQHQLEPTAEKSRLRLAIDNIRDTLRVVGELGLPLAKAIEAVKDIIGT